jgi:hypothetical protein
MRQLFDWEEHEKHVAAIYRLLGYRVTSNINITGQQTDLLCAKEIPGAGIVVLYVDCKYTQDDERNTISKDSVNQFITNFHALKQAHGWTAGILVSNREFSQHAKSAAAPHRDIVLKTVNELYADLFQIPSYLHRCIHEYEIDETFTDYIPLNATVQESAGSGGGQKLEELFEKWLHQPNNSQLVLLGDFGAGKTTFMRQIHYKCAKQFLAGSFARMPLYIQLRDYFDVKSGNELIEKFFSLELATRVPQRLFDEFTKVGRFLVLLDGFDEMGVISDNETRRKNYLKLRQLTRPASKVVITCRPAYFVTHEELLEVFGFYKGQMGLLAPPTRGDKKTTKAYSSLTTQLKAVSHNEELKELLAAVGSIERTSTIAALELFDDAQIKAYLELQRDRILEESEGQLDDASLLTRMGQIYDLDDLAKRPILLKLIVNTLPLFKQDSNGQYAVKSSSQTFEDITPSVLYYVYTEGELSREYEKGELRWKIERADRLKVIGALAFEMFENDSLVLVPEAFSAIVARHLSPSDEDLEKFATDIRTCSFLTLDRNGLLRFAHKSFFEYYVSQHLVSLFVSVRQAGEILSKRALSEEIYYFLGDLIHSFYPSLLRVLHEVTTTDESVRRCNAMNLLNYAGHPRPLVADFAGKSLSYVKLNIPILEFRNSHIGGARWVRCNIDQFRVEKTKTDKFVFQGTVIRQLVCTSSEIEFLDCARSEISMNVAKSRINTLQLTNVSLVKSTFSQSSVVIGRCHDSLFKTTCFENCLLMSSDPIHLTTSRFQNVVFDQCVFLYIAFENPLLNSAQFKNCIFIRCYLNDGLALQRLKGSRGFFEYKTLNKERARSVEIAGQPYLWNSRRAARGPASLPNVDALDDKDFHLQQRKLIESLSWEDGLAASFSNLRPTDRSTLTIGTVRKKLRQIEKFWPTNN